jgi:hypothetical protein
MITRMAREREGQSCRWIDRKGHICLDWSLGWDGADVVHWVELVGCLISSLLNENRMKNITSMGLFAR